MVEPIANPNTRTIAIALLRRRNPTTASADFERRRRAVDEILYAEITRRRQEPDLDERDDVFSTLLLARDDSGTPLSDEEVRDELLTLLIAGHETTATGLANLLKGGISHDQVTRFLASKPRTSADLWKIAKPFVRRIQSDQAAMIVDDSISEKPYTDENDIVCWHYDHSHQRTVKGINFLNALYHSQGVSLPVGFALIAKTEHYVDKKDGKEKRRSPTSKNEHLPCVIGASRPEPDPLSLCAQ